VTRILILYGTTDGHTAKIAGFLADRLRSLGAGVDVGNAATSDPDLADYAGIIVAASVHAGGYQRSVGRWVRTHAEALRGRRTAFLSVCLGVLQQSPEVIAELSAIKGRFVARTRWTPTQFKIVAGALPYTRYGWLKRIIMRRIARKAGGATDTAHDHEYTDWHDLRAFAESFCSLCIPQPEAPRSCQAGSACSCASDAISGRPRVLAGAGGGGSR
jgi:menaquinone-dependent protoporphyrinogen oxidase